MANYNVDIVVAIKGNEKLTRFKIDVDCVAVEQQILSYSSINIFSSYIRILFKHYQ